MNQLFVYSSTAVLLLFIVLIVVYFKYHYKYGRLERLMGLTYVVIGFVYWMIHLNSTGGIVSFPHFYRVGGGLWMLSVVLLYYCSRIVYHKPITWREYLQLLPVFIYFVNFMPFILQNADYKIEVINNVLLNNLTYNFEEGALIPGDFIILLRVFHRLLIAGLIGALIYSERKQSLSTLGYRTVVNFYFWFVLLSSFPEIFTYFGFTTFDGVLLPSYLYLVLGLIFLIMYFISPQYLYGFDVDFNNRFLKSEIVNEDGLQSELIDGDINSGEALTSRNRMDLAKIEFYLDDKMPFLKVNFSLIQLEKDLGIPTKRISQAIKLKHEMNFAQFINKKRITYVVQKLEQDKMWRNYSVEALALNVGFNSPNSFYSYFKNHTGKTPREFIDLLGFKEEMTG